MGSTVAPALSADAAVTMLMPLLATSSLVPNSVTNKAAVPSTATTTAIANGMRAPRVFFLGICIKLIRVPFARDLGTETVSIKRLR